MTSQQIDDDVQSKQEPIWVYVHMGHWPGMIMLFLRARLEQSANFKPAPF